MVASPSRATAPDDGLLFGAMLRRFRLGAGLSQNELAHRAGCDPAYVNRLERDMLHGNPSRRVVEALAEAVDGSAGDHERLLVAAGYCPAVIRSAGGWDHYLAAQRGLPASALDAVERTLTGADAEAWTVRDPNDTMQQGGARGKDAEILGDHRPCLG